MKHIKLLFLSVAFTALTVLVMGCSPPEGNLEQITVTISHIVKEGSWGCIGEDYKTYVKTDDGRMDYICGKWGEKGDKISGYWRTGDMNSSSNGFKLYK